MGHAEMILAVAGMSQVEVDERTRRMAGEGAGQTPAERAAFAFARKQAAEPWSITDAGIGELVKEFGTAKAWQVIWWVSRCHYMTRVADAFQLPLEPGNPFEAMPGAKPLR
jgi:hypothetical protein